MKKVLIKSFIVSAIIVSVFVFVPNNKVNACDYYGCDSYYGGYNNYSSYSGNYYDYNSYGSNYYDYGCSYGCGSNYSYGSSYTQPYQYVNYPQIVYVPNQNNNNFVMIS